MSFTQGFDWTDARIARAKVLLSDGHPASVIGTEFGISRCAVIGKMRRLKFKWEVTRDTRVENDPRHKVKRTRTKFEGDARPTRAFPFNSAPKPPLPPDRKLVNKVHEAPAATRKTLIELAPGDCRWPCGHPAEDGFYFCGAPKHDELPYCLSHCRIAYAPTDGLRTMQRERDREVVG